MLKTNIKLFIGFLVISWVFLVYHIKVLTKISQFG